MKNWIKCKLIKTTITICTVYVWWAWEILFNFSIVYATHDDDDALCVPICQSHVPPRLNKCAFGRKKLDFILS